MRRDDPTLSMFFDQILYFINFIIVKRTGKLLQAISTGKARLWKLIGHFSLLKAESIAHKSYLWENLVLWHPILIVILGPFTEPLVSGGPFSAKNQNRILWGTWSHLIMEKNSKTSSFKSVWGRRPLNYGRMTIPESNGLFSSLKHSQHGNFSQLYINFQKKYGTKQSIRPSVAVHRKYSRLYGVITTK